MPDVHLLVIDPQRDFCDPQGALYVPGAEKDMERLAAFLLAHVDSIQAIHCSLDLHHLMDIAHPCWWVDRNGSPPAPFTIITSAAVKAGEWRAAVKDAQQRSADYVKALEANGRYPLCIWPPHCLIGSTGAAVVQPLLDAFQRWEEQHLSNVNYVLKGFNPWTEHYSAIQADVPDPSDPGTMANKPLVTRLAQADLVVVAGEAGSHCVANTLRDIAACPNKHVQESLSNFVLLADATSPVPGFESHQEEFIREAAQKGMKLGNTMTSPASMLA